MHDAEARGDVREAVEALPPSEAEALQHPRRRGDRQRDQQKERREAHEDKAALGDILEDPFEIQPLIQGEIRQKMRRRVGEAGEPEPPAPAPPPKVIKPPKPEPKKQTGLQRPDARKRPKPKPSATPTPPQSAFDPRAEARRAPATGGTGTASATPGLEFGPPGPGVPTGTDSGGDWYLAGVQQKIWSIWNQQLKSGFTQSVGVTFTILPDGNVTGVRVTQPSGVSLLDMAAQRAILNAAPFGPLPREYGQNPRTIQALFKPS